MISNGAKFEEVLKSIEENGSFNVKQAFCKFLGHNIGNIEIVKFRAKTTSLKEFLNWLKNFDKKKTLAIYEEAISGLPGAAILFISQEDSKFLIDILNKNFGKNVAFLNSADYSALKELFNILSNYYISNFSDVFNIQLLLGIPIMADFSELENAILKIFSKNLPARAGKKDCLIAFESIFSILQLRSGLMASKVEPSIAANNQIKINIIFLFNNGPVA
ncbi:hypothetical protein HZB04_02000 [Candidatus Wolfebacteria bacterium]|nr:hypothetical protein [Candidatus Wolfebacteria bacterium]